MNKGLIIKLLIIFIPVLILIAVAIFVLTAKNPPINVTSVIPQSKASNQSLFTAISVTFSRPVTSSEKTKIYITSTPMISGQTIWSQDNKTLSLTPSSPMSPSTVYGLIVNFGNTSLDWSFQTVDRNSISAEDQAKIQGEMDVKAAGQLKSFYDQNPWYKNIPIVSSDFFVGYDGQKKEFFAYLYPSRSSSVAIDEQVASLKSLVISALTNIGAKPDLNKIEWNISPK